MTVKKTIAERRAYRSLLRTDIGDELVSDLVECAQLAPSCFNNQPSRFVFVRERETLERVFGTLSQANAWGTAASMVIAVASRADLGCRIAGREYFLFDAGIATAFIILRATELGLVAHPIAGFSERKTKAAMDIPEDMTLIALVMVGTHSEKTGPLMSEEQAEVESVRPERKPAGEIAFQDVWKDESDE